MKKNKEQKRLEKRMAMSQGELMAHSPNPMHLDACQQGSRVFRNKKKYTRKGKERFDERKIED